jgi:two-component system response regulator YcbB
VLGEAGCQDIVEIVLWLKKKGSLVDGAQEAYRLSGAFDYLREKYETEQGISMNTAAIEQRIRRTIKSALKNLANLGLEDYYDEVFTRYSSVLFDFGEVRKEMDFERGKSRYGGKINAKKFVEGILILLMDKV